LNKLVLIFNYFKEAFHINRQNKNLYKPQLLLIALRVVLILFVGIGVYNWIGASNINSITHMRPDQILGFFFSQGFKLLAILVAYALISVVVEAGLLNMYKKAVLQGHTGTEDFKEGLSKYFIKLLLGDLLIILCYIISLPFYLILGIITLTAGLTLIPIVVGVFLTMWKISLVMNDTGIITAIKDSFGFAKRNFLPLAVLQIIHWAFTQGAGGGSGSGGNFNMPNSNSYNGNYSGEFDPGFGDGFMGVPGMEEVIRIIKIVIAVLLPVISIAVIAGSVIAMIFEVFFSLALFVAYKNDFKVEEKQSEICEVSSEILLEEQRQISGEFTETAAEENQEDLTASENDVEHIEQETRDEEVQQ